MPWSNGVYILFISSQVEINWYIKLCLVFVRLVCISTLFAVCMRVSTVQSRKNAAAPGYESRKKKSVDVAVGASILRSITMYLCIKKA